MGVAKTVAITEGDEYFYREVANSASKKSYDVTIYTHVATVLKLILQGLDTQFKIPRDYFNLVNGSLVIGHLRMGLGALYTSKASHNSRISMIKMIQGNGEYMKARYGNLGKLRRIWGWLYRHLPAELVERIICLYPKRLV